MEKVTKKFVNRLVYGRDWEQKEIDFEDPKLVDTKDITSFYFSEQSFVIDGEDKYFGSEKNISPVYHVGTRISVLEALKMCSNNPETLSYFQKLYEKNPNASLCKSNMGYLFLMGDEDITLEEYINSKKNTK